MKLQLAKDSLFAVLLRSPWWISVAVAAGITAVARLLLPEDYRLLGMVTAAPFLVTAGIAAWKQAKSPGAARIAATLEAASALSLREFVDALAAGFERQGYEVRRLAKSAADLELSKAGRKSLVGCRRWKAASTGVEPLRDLHAAGEASEAGECVYVALGGITDNAQRFATDKHIRLLQGAELAQTLGGLPAAGRRKA